jgi:acyl-CoA thioester hydrolase
MPILHNPFPVRVYWEDTDAGGVVFYANYLKFFERARTEWLRSKGIQQSLLQSESGCIFVVTDVQIRYRASARLDDELQVSVQVHTQGKASMELNQQAWRGDTLLAEGRVRVGCVNAQTLRPQRLPDHLLPLLCR